MRFTDEHGAIRHAVAQFIDKEINPHCDAWEEAGIFPAHEVFRRNLVISVSSASVNRPNTAAWAWITVTRSSSRRNWAVFAEPV
jgi:hypothetical protein